ncbi:MAG: hypothetical protein RR595_13710 [Lysinibacillus sp.]
MFRLLKNEKGAIFSLAIALLFLITAFLTMYCISYETQYNTYNALESVNVRATINVLGQIMTDGVEP